MVVDEEKTVFFTGSAGTGKSLLLRAIIDALRRKFAARPDRLAVCASTGVAAQNIGGMCPYTYLLLTYAPSMLFYFFFPPRGLHVA